MNIRDVMQHEEDAILAEWTISRDTADARFPLASVTEPEILLREPIQLRLVHPVVLEPLPGQKRNLALVLVCPSLKYKFLWTHVDNDDYRDDYKTFLKEFHGVTEELPRNKVVDHVFARSRAIAFGTPWVRMMLAEPPINSSFGPGYERMRLHGVGTSGRSRPIDTLLLLKINGMPCPKQGASLTAEMLGHIHRVSALYAIPYDEVLGDVEDLMKVAAFRAGK